MNILILGDPHGIIPKKINSAKFTKFDAIICTGDFVPDKKLRKIIFAAIRQGKNWRTTIPKKKLNKILKSDYSDGMKVLSYLNSIGKPAYIIPGNWDLSEKTGDAFYKKKIKKMKNMVDCDEKIKSTRQYTIIGYGKTFGPELYPDREITMRDKKSFSSLVKKYDKLFAIAKRKQKKIIFLVHNPPFNTKLDKINNKESPANGKHFGSQLVRRMIEKHKPAICICGHMHENRGTIKLGRTICLNTGCLHEKGFFLLNERGKIEKLRAN